ncbi:MAG TPA: TIGR02281 family clan AA aspartic protease [Stellaceae bacterium]|nr:TIGR02281 family clan AA aspartic protease [Stellaceae bacterium]
MSDAYGPSGGAMLRRALLLAIGCGAAAYTVPRFLGSGILGAPGSDAPSSPPAPASRVAARLPADLDADPAEPAETIFDDTLTVRAGPYNQFFVRAAINGVMLPFIIDTGAFMVSLRREDAELVGIDVGALHWDLAISTANGNAFAARVTLPSVRLDRITEYNVPATVLQQKTDSPSLLGMSFLSRLKSWQIRDGVLTIRY